MHERSLHCRAGVSDVIDEADESRGTPGPFAESPVMDVSHRYAITGCGACVCVVCVFVYMCLQVSQQYASPQLVMEAACMYACAVHDGMCRMCVIMCASVSVCLYFMYVCVVYVHGTEVRSTMVRQRFYASMHVCIHLYIQTFICICACIHTYMVVYMWIYPI
jgi:hypothetical protein